MKRYVPHLLLAVVAVLAATQLLVPPIVGTADQGDYDRIMFPVGLAHVGTSYEDTVFLWVQQHYRVVPADWSRLVPSS
jgi:ATP sulfurylase